MEDYIYNAIKSAESEIRCFEKHFGPNMGAAEFMQSRNKWQAHCNSALTRLKTCPAYLIDQNSRIFDYVYQRLSERIHMVYIWQDCLYFHWKTMPEELQDHIKNSGYGDIATTWVWSDKFTEGQSI